MSTGVVVAMGITLFGKVAIRQSRHPGSGSSLAIRIILMQICAMSNTASTRTGVTIRLAPEVLGRLRGIAEAEHRSVAGYLEMLIERELVAQDNAERVVHIHVAPELVDVPQGALNREPGESAERYEYRRTVLDGLFGKS
jgi:hypothetical protein